jgi:hypothetical protein
MKKKKENTTLGDMLNPEVRNILEKLKRLSVLTSDMGIDTKKATDMDWLSENLPQMKYVEHKHFKEAVNLVGKLQKINKSK